MGHDYGETQNAAHITTESRPTSQRNQWPTSNGITGPHRPEYAKIEQFERQWLERPWQKVRDSVEVKLFSEGGKLYVLAKSEGRQAKERAMRRKKLARLLWKLHAMRLHPPSRDQLLLRIGAARKDAGRAAKFVTIQIPAEGVAVTR